MSLLLPSLQAFGSEVKADDGRTHEAYLRGLIDGWRAAGGPPQPVHLILDDDGFMSAWLPDPLFDRDKEGLWTSSRLATS